MIDFKSFKKPGGNTDWTAYRGAQVAAGEVCQKCHQHIFSFFGIPTAGPRLCGECKALAEDAGEVNSSSYVRCPACGHQMGTNGFDGELHSDGTHDVSCGECDHDFEVTTNVSFSFESPARLAKEEVQP
jgi:hypothetical protein